MNKIKDKKIIVIGLGISGRAASLLLKSEGAIVRAIDSSVSDQLEATAKELIDAGIDVELGKDIDESIKDSDLLVVSPAVKDDSAIIKTAQEYSVPVISEIELGYYFCKAPIVAVTGTNGKSTIVTLIDLLLKSSGKNSILCGNIGEAFCGKLDQVRQEDTVVLEVSSFQLKRILDFKPKVACITNISQNHLDWHLDFDEYFNSKKRIYENQSDEDFLVLNYDDINLRALGELACSNSYFFSKREEVEGAFYKDGSFFINVDNQAKEICKKEDIRLKGEHNISNILCSSLSAYLMGATIEGMQKVLKNFNGLDHRFQTVATIDGVEFIDDSKATTVDATRAALNSCLSKTILIAGGRDKGSDFTKIQETITSKVKALILIGEAKTKIRESLRESVKTYDAEDMDEAVSASFKNADSGDIVLLSPMCASFDMYKSYKERGDVFKRAVERLR